MASITQVCRELRRLFEEEAEPLARREGLRERTMRFAQVAYLFVLGWWQQPQAGPSALARFGGSLDLTLSKQEVDAHFTEATARWLLALLRRAVCVLICAREGVKLSLLQQFRAVLVEDGSTITLPESLKSVWRGCGGSPAPADKARATEAALKVTVRFDLLGGRLDGPHVQAGRQHELRSVLREHEMAPGSLWIADLGYWTLKWLSSLVQSGVYFLLRYKPGIILWHEGKRLDLLTILPQTVGDRLELLVEVGAKRLLKGVRLLAERVPAEVAQERQGRYREYARAHGKPENPLVLELAHWTLVVTNVPVGMLSLEQALALLRARWQIELLFKLWKEQALLDEWTGTKPARVLCEVYAKLLAMVIQHWVLLLACWDDPHRSLSGVAEIVREQLPLLVHGLAGHHPLQRGLRLLINSVKGGCAIEDRRTRPSTSRRLQSAGGDGLT